eukprot:2586562-Pleurochrysis_carterae.AAC.1
MCPRTSGCWAELVAPEMTRELPSARVSKVVGAWCGRVRGLTFEEEQEDVSERAERRRVEVRQRTHGSSAQRQRR